MKGTCLSCGEICNVSPSRPVCVSCDLRIAQRMLNEIKELRDFEQYRDDLQEFLAYRQSLRERYDVV